MAKPLLDDSTEAEATESEALDTENRRNSPCKVRPLKSLPVQNEVLKPALVDAVAGKFLRGVF